jgi:hypothetical protein
MPAPRRPGIFCLEGAWNRRLDDKASVLPTLELMERLRVAQHIHRDVGTEEELYHYLKLWSQRGYSTYEVLYFAFHGVKGGINVGRGVVPLEELADKLEGKAAGRIVYFGSCSVMRDRPAVEEFRRLTKAKAVCGYLKDVDWIESAAFDLVVLSSLVEGGRIDARFNRVRTRFPDMTKALGFQTSPTYSRAR